MCAMFADPGEVRVDAVSAPSAAIQFVLSTKIHFTLTNVSYSIQKKIQGWYFCFPRNSRRGATFQHSRLQRNLLN